MRAPWVPSTFTVFSNLSQDAALVPSSENSRFSSRRITGRLFRIVIDDASENLHMLTVLSTLGPYRLDAGQIHRYLAVPMPILPIAGTLSERFRQVVAFPAVAPRVLIMGR